MLDNQLCILVTRGQICDEADVVYLVLTAGNIEPNLSQVKSQTQD